MLLCSGKHSPKRSHRNTLNPSHTHTKKCCLLVEIKRLVLVKQHMMARFPKLGFVKGIRKLIKKNGCRQKESVNN